MSIQQAKYQLICNLISRKAICFFIGCVGTSLLIIYGLIGGQTISDIVLMIGSWTASISAFASIWCVANHFDKKNTKE